MPVNKNSRLLESLLILAVFCVPLALMAFNDPTRFGFGESDSSGVPPSQLVTLETRDQVKIAARYYPAPDRTTDRPTLILLHGNNSTKER